MASELRHWPELCGATLSLAKEHRGIPHEPEAHCELFTSSWGEERQLHGMPGRLRQRPPKIGGEERPWCDREERRDTKPRFH
ncbi:hypothetical protein NDU88_000765 [Pleurodeles waltl]|uniref:Uncharacterized protein n=1 Tax=Pleurodeles waltl TaxID=8319 RepID=A0AAV7TFX7_PLEWA|nr:hypothetical protein NDU88_000765 [Pleurodeles waltl]